MSRRVTANSEMMARVMRGTSGLALADQSSLVGRAGQGERACLRGQARMGNEAIARLGGGFDGWPGSSRLAWGLDVWEGEFPT